MQTASITPPNRVSYPSDLIDRQWRDIEPLIPPERDRGRHRETDVRDIVNAINYRWSTGCVWRMLPHDFPPWATVYTYFRKWQRDGTLREIREMLVKRRNLPETSNPVTQCCSDTQRDREQTVCKGKHDNTPTLPFSPAEAVTDVLIEERA